MTLARVRDEVYQELVGFVPAGTRVYKYAPEKGKRRRNVTSVIIDDVLPTTVDSTDMIELQLRVEIPAATKLEIAYGKLDDILEIVHYSLPVNWQAVEGWEIEHDDEGPPVIRARVTVIGHPTSEVEIDPDFLMWNDADLFQISAVPEDLIRVS